MKIITFIQSWINSLQTAFRELKVRPTAEPKPHNLVSTIDSARQDWQQALREFDQVENECIDYVIHKIISSERYYMFLLKQARQEGSKAWPATTDNVVTALSDIHP
ncbi:MAG: DUF2508 family protein [Desulfotomaculaceae bacterium]|nr:DUF2508 family protein [Desulfotomaculaceae bacterium]